MDKQINIEGSGAGTPDGVLWFDEMHQRIPHMGTIPKEKRFDSEKVRPRRREAVDTDVKFYNSTVWRKYSTKLRARRQLCDIHMNYVLVNDLGLDDILPWYSQLDTEMKLRFLRRKGYDGDIRTSDVTDHIIPIKAPFSGSYMNPRNHQAASHWWHNVKRKMEQDEISEEYVDTASGRIPKRMQEGRKRMSDTDAQILERINRRPRGGANPS